MVRFGAILIAYFVVGATMWAGGAIAWNPDDGAGAGVGQYLIDDPEGGDLESDQASEDIRNLGGPIQNIVGSLGGGLIAVWNLMVKFVGYLFWPMTVLSSVGAPVEIVVLGGGSLVVAFIASVVRTVRGSA